jgi:hypothetical protein
MSKSITLSVCLESYRPRKDKSFTLTFSTQELATERVLDVAYLHNKIGVLFFADKEVMSADELTMLDSTELDIGVKSPSQRLRNVLYVLHSQLGGNSDNFKDFYAQQMDMMINKIKAKLEDA